jgi:hypothetical protein
LQVTAHHLVESTSQAIAGTPPPPDPLKPKDGGATKLALIEILMDDCIPPEIQFLEKIHSGCVLWMMDPDFVPETDPETIEVRADAAGLSIAAIQEAASSQLESHDLLQCGRKRDHRQDVGDALAMKVATEPLELRGEHYGISPVELLGIEPPATMRPADRGVPPCDFVESPCSRRSPVRV